MQHETLRRVFLGVCVDRVRDRRGRYRRGGGPSRVARAMRDGALAVAMTATRSTFDAVADILYPLTPRDPVRTTRDRWTSLSCFGGRHDDCAARLMGCNCDCHHEVAT